MRALLGPWQRGLGLIRRRTGNIAEKEYLRKFYVHMYIITHMAQPLLYILILIIVLHYLHDQLVLENNTSLDNMYL